MYIFVLHVIYKKLQLGKTEGSFHPNLYEEAKNEPPLK